MDLEQRMNRAEETLVSITSVLLSHGERLDDYFRALHESREDFEFKINAIIDLQLKNEAGILTSRDETSA